jgi:hypothetical protein
VTAPDPLKADVVRAVKHLLAHPDLLATVLAMANLEEDGLEPDPACDGTTLVAVGARGYLRAAYYGLCASCFSAVAFYPDGKQLSFPSLSHHRCGVTQLFKDPEQAKAVPVAQPRPQAAPAATPMRARPTGL